jgi:molybdopterin synthase catalytic subunit
MANPVSEILLTEVELELPVFQQDFSAGAIVDFWGTVREREGEAEITGLFYEVHRAMAEHQLRLIAEEAIERFDLKLAIIHHRIGFVPVGEASLFLRVAAAHRSEAFRAGQWVVDELKKSVPIWKEPKFTAGQRLKKRVAAAETNL